MIGPIPFDPARFRSAAAHYLDGRPDYAPGLIQGVATLCGLDGTGHLLDLGCGPGQLAAAFRPMVAGALGMDPEPEMLAIAKARAAASGLAITFRQGASHDLASGMGPFRLVTIGRAFHWMDRPETLRVLDRLTDPAAAIALFSTSHADVPDNAWRRDLQAVMDSEMGSGNRQLWKQPGWVRHEAILLDSPFNALQRLSIIDRRRTPCAHFVHRALSMSSTTRAKLGEDGAARLTAAIDQVVARAATDGAVTEVMESTALIAHRPPA